MNNYLVSDGSCTFVFTPVHDDLIVVQEVEITTKEMKDALAEWLATPPIAATVVPRAGNTAPAPPLQQLDLSSWIAS